MKLTKKFKIAALVLVLIPLLVAFIDHPILHGLYGVIALVSVSIALFLAGMAIRIDRQKYYSKLTINDL
ncbi:MAG: hypothetical protein V7749_01045 [Cocleimonas sp.]